jgi:hypothetical protein
MIGGIGCIRVFVLLMRRLSGHLGTGHDKVKGPVPSFVDTTARLPA